MQYYCFMLGKLSEPDGCLTDDDNMSQFVQSETEIGNITTSCKVSSVNLMVV